MMNQFLLTGEVSRTPTIGKSAKGTSFYRISVECKENKIKSFFNFVAFGNKADEIDTLNLNIGDVVTIDSTINNNSYEKDGKKVYGYSFVINSVEIEEKMENNTLNDDLPFADGGAVYSPEDLM